MSSACAQLDTRVVAGHHAPGQLLCHPEPLLAAMHFEGGPALRERVSPDRAVMAEGAQAARR